MTSSQDALLTFYTGLRGFYVYRYDNNQYDKYAVADYTKLPGKMVLCVVGHMPREVSRYPWFATQVVSTNTKRSPLTQGGF